MLSYKYYQNAKYNNTTLEPIKSANRIFQSTIVSMINELLDEFKNPINNYHRRYNIWDNIANHIDTIINGSSLSISQIDKIYLLKLLIEFRNKSVVDAGVEYYCLRHIIQLPVFRINKSIADLYQRISQYINSLYKDRQTRQTVIFFAKNVRKVGLIKRAYKSRVILRTLWCDIYTCYSMGQQVLSDIVNKSDILNALKCAVNNSSNSDKDPIIVEDASEILSQDDGFPITDFELDTELDTESVISSVEMDVEIAIESQNAKVDSQIVLDDIPHDQESTNDNYDGEIEEIALEPDDW